MLLLRVERRARLAAAFLGTHRRGRHDQPELWRADQRVRRREDDDGAAGRPAAGVRCVAGNILTAMHPTPAATELHEEAALV